MRHEFWTIAYRKRQGETTLLGDKQTPFQVVPNNWRYWYADPHLICINGGTWLFAEAYDRILRRGVISCCTITENGPTPWKVVLKQPYHLSYPHLLENNGEIYMVPESYVANEIAFFRAKCFPDQWEKISIIKHGGEPVDSTVFHYDSKSWMLTLECSEDILKLYQLTDHGIVGDGFCAKTSDFNARPAGYLFRIGDVLVRPAQDCTDSYGCALNFYEVMTVEENCYKEVLIEKIKPEELKTNLNFVPQGIHTYNMTDEYEVVDFKGYETDLLAFVMRPVWFVWRRIRKVFGL